MDTLGSLKKEIKTSSEETVDLVAPYQKGEGQLSVQEKRTSHAV